MPSNLQPALMGWTIAWCGLLVISHSIRSWSVLPLAKRWAPIAYVCVFSASAAAEAFWFLGLTAAIASIAGSALGTLLHLGLRAALHAERSTRASTTS